MTISRFDRASLPLPESFYRRELGELRRADRKGWAKPKAGCPFHKSESKTSFHANLINGAFCCFSCGAKGGDVLAFVRMRYKLSFEDAAKQLGAWRDDLTPEHTRKLEEARRAQERIQAEQLSQKESERAERIAARDQLHCLENQYSRANARLSHLRRGSPERYRGEQGVAWWFLADSLPRIREAEAHYWRKAGLEVSL